jgi:hypothetical protein
VDSDDTIPKLKGNKEEFQRACYDLGKKIAEKAKELGNGRTVTVTVIVFSGGEETADYYVVDGIMAEAENGNSSCHVEVIHKRNYPEEFKKWIENKRLKGLFSRQPKDPPSKKAAHLIGVMDADVIIAIVL